VHKEFLQKACTEDIDGADVRSKRETGGFLIPSNEKHVGLARALSKLGYCSRAQAADLIRAGKVRVNGSITKNSESPVRLGKIASR